MVRRLLVPALGAGGAIFLMVALADLAGLPYAAVPFVTSIVLVMSLPGSPPAQPRALLGGHIVCTLAGLAVVNTIGAGMAAPAVAVALAVAAMVATRTMHPPAGINAFMVVTMHLPWKVLVTPVGSGALILAGYAWVYHRLTRAAPWPGVG